MKITLFLLLFFCGIYSFAQTKYGAIWHVKNKKIDFTTSPATVTDLPLTEQSASGDGVATTKDGKRLMYYSLSRGGIYFEDGSFLTGSENKHGAFIPCLVNDNLYFLISNTKTSYLIDLRSKTLIPLDYIWSNVETTSNPKTFFLQEQCKSIWYLTQPSTTAIQLNFIEDTIIRVKKIIDFPFETYSFNVSPRGNLIALLSSLSYNNTIYLAQFDISTETIEPIFSYSLDDKSELLSASCFSPDQTKLYVTILGAYNRTTNTSPYQVIQLSIDENQSLVSPTIVYQQEIANGIFPKMQLGFDGRIYISYTVKIPRIDIISKPNLSGAACNFIQGGIPFNTFTILPPTFITLPSPKACSIGIAVNLGCVPDPTLFSIENGQGIVSVLWQFGDGQTSTETEPSHSYASEGRFTVNVEIKKTDNTTETLSKEIEIFEKPKKPTIIRIE
jgi:hypothetical protein